MNGWASIAGLSRDQQKSESQSLPFFIIITNLEDYSFIVKIKPLKISK